MTEAVMTEEGVRRSRELFARHFGKNLGVGQRYASRRLMPSPPSQSWSSDATQLRGTHMFCPLFAKRHVLFDLVVEVCSCLSLHDPSNICTGPQGTSCNCAGKCSENDRTHGFQLCTSRCTDSRTSVLQAPCADDAELYVGWGKRLSLSSAKEEISFPVANEAFERLRNVWVKINLTRTRSRS